MADPNPERPAGAGVPERTPETMEVESAHLLANDAKGRLGDKGFDDDQIQRWADAFIAEGNAGDVDDFVAWIDAKENSGAPYTGSG